MAGETHSSAFELTPTKLVYGGAALGYAHGQTILAMGGLPDEPSEVEVVREAKGVVQARVRRVLIPSPERAIPPCPYFGTCGGCHYQHLNYSSQIRWKREIFRETLRRIGKIAWEGEIALHHAEPWDYRNQAELKVDKTATGEIALGFYQAGSHHLAPIERCEILSPLLNDVLHKLNRPEWRVRLHECAAVDLLADDRDECVRVLLRVRRISRQAKTLAQDLLQGIPHVTGVVLETAEARWKVGEDAIQYAVGDFTYRISAGAFFQASRFLVSDLVRSVLEGAQGKVAMDLYAGVGLFSLPLAQKFQQVLAVERELLAARDLEWNSHTAGFKNLRASNEAVEDFLRRYVGQQPDFVVLDPPRAGAGPQVLGRLAALRPMRICYVSCHPPTQARDLAFLLRRGYRLESVELFDFFPQTYHIESLAHLGRATE